MTQPIHQTKKRVADGTGGKGKMSAQGEPPVKLLLAMTGKASAAKTAKGAEPVFAYIASLPQPQRGTEIKPEPPVTPIGMGKSTRGVELASVDDFDERQLASWMKQAATMPFVGGKNR